MQYAVPRGNREYACWPPLAELPELVQRNAAAIRSFSFKVLDVPVGDYRRMCLDAVQEAAAAWARQVGLGERSARLERPLIATGHQPELHHAGVWIKNHLASRLGRAVGGTSFDLIVDNDVPKHLGILMPVKARGAWRQREASLADRRPDVPFEEYPPEIADKRAFIDETKKLSEGRPFHNQAVRLAEDLTEAAGVGLSLADVTSTVRLAYEREVGVENVELPVSRLASTPVFAAFAASLLCEAVRFSEIYNRSLADYRRRNSIKNAANPLPDLDVDGDAVETPFWIWTAGGRRERLYASVQGRDIRLYKGGEDVGVLSADGVGGAAGSWEKLHDAGFRIRPRALVTTIFMRLFVAELFIHGIGGAKYDEVTDRIIRDFYGVEAPAYATISATLKIDWDFEPVDPRETGALKQAIREIDYNPQRYITPDGQSSPQAELIAEKWRHVESSPETHEGRLEKFLRIRQINAALSDKLSGLREEKVQQLSQRERRVENDRVTFSREYPCLLLGARRAAEFYAEVLKDLPGATGFRSSEPGSEAP